MLSPRPYYFVILPLPIAEFKERSFLQLDTFSLFSVFLSIQTNKLQRLMFAHMILALNAAVAICHLLSMQSLCTLVIHKVDMLGRFVSFGRVLGFAETGNWLVFLLCRPRKQKQTTCYIDIKTPRKNSCSKVFCTVSEPPSLTVGVFRCRPFAPSCLTGIGASGDPG